MVEGQDIFDRGKDIFKDYVIKLPASGKLRRIGGNNQMGVILQQGPGSLLQRYNACAYRGAVARTFL